MAMSYLTKDEVLRKFFLHHDNTSEVWELYFREGGKSVLVATYYEPKDAEDYAEEDSLAFWMNTLKRTWDDEDFESDRREEADKVLKFREWD